MYGYTEKQIQKAVEELNREYEEAQKSSNPSSETTGKRVFFNVYDRAGGHPVRREKRADINKILRSHGVRYDATQDAYFFAPENIVADVSDELNKLGIEVEIRPEMDLGGYTDQRGTLVGDASKAEDVYPEQKSSNPGPRDDIALDLLPHVEKLIKHWDDRGPQFDKAEKEIHKLAGLKTIPRGLTKEERADPYLLARRIACIAHTKKQYGIDPFAVCRGKIK